MSRSRADTGGRTRVTFQRGAKRHSGGGARGTTPPLPEGAGEWLVTVFGKTSKHGSSPSTLPPGSRLSGNRTLAPLGDETVALEWVEISA